jgi:hypothetical protein
MKQFYWGYFISWYLKQVFNETCFIEDAGLMGYDTLQIGMYVPTFWRS